MATDKPGFMRLPPEVRCMIYALLLAKPKPIIIREWPRVIGCPPDIDSEFLEIQPGYDDIEEIPDGALESKGPFFQFRSLFCASEDDIVVGDPRSCTAILRVNKTIHREAEFELFQKNTLVIDSVNVAYFLYEIRARVLTWAPRLTFFVCRHDDYERWLDFFRDYTFDNTFWQDEIRIMFSRPETRWHAEQFNNFFERREFWNHFLRYIPEVKVRAGIFNSILDIPHNL
ncbi:hypothetical protein SCUP515_05399 [Seiridium cupressi]